MSTEEMHLPGRQGRLVFAYLVAEQGRPIPRDELAEAVWGEAPPPTWEKAPSVIVSKVRGLLVEVGMDGPNVLTGAFGCYRLKLAEGSWVDVIAATEAARDAEAALTTGDADTAKDAAALSESLLRQPFVPGEEGAWVEDKRREFEDVRSRALETLATSCLRLGEGSEAVKWAEQTIALAPFRETGYRHLMEAHAAAGNRAEALRVYDRCRRLLADELGTYPSPQTESVYRALLDTPTAPNRSPDAAPSAASRPQARRPRRRARIAVLVSVAAFAAVSAALVAARGGGPVARPDSLLVIDAANGTIDAVVPVGPDPGQVEVVGKWVFVTSTTHGALYRLDRGSGAVTISGKYSAGLNLERQGDALWVPSLDDAVMRLIDVGSLDHSWVDEIPIPEVRDPSVLAVAVGGGSVWVADTATHSVSHWHLAREGSPVLVRTYPLRSADWTLGAAFGAGAAWFALGYPADAVLRINAATGAARGIPVGNWPTAPAVGFGSVWVPMFADDTVWRLDPSTGRPEAIISVGRGPFDVAIGSRSVWVTDHCDGTLKRIDPSTNRIVKTIQTGLHPQWLAAASGSVWVGIAAGVRPGWSCGAYHST